MPQSSQWVSPSRVSVISVLSSVFVSIASQSRGHHRFYQVCPSRALLPSRGNHNCHKLYHRAGSLLVLLVSWYHRVRRHHHSPSHWHHSARRCHQVYPHWYHRAGLCLMLYRCAGHSLDNKSYDGVTSCHGLWRRAPCGGRSSASRFRSLSPAAWPTGRRLTGWQILRATCRSRHPHSSPSRSRRQVPPARGAAPCLPFCGQQRRSHWGLLPRTCRQRQPSSRRLLQLRLRCQPQAPSLT